MELLAGIDIGNAKTEVVFMEDGELQFVRQPSVISILSSKPEASDLEEDYLIKNLSNNLSVQIFSEGLKHDGMYFVGEKALSSGKKTSNMNIASGLGKSQNDIPLITSLSIVASIGLQREYKATNNLPKTLNLDLKMATAIPSSEYNKKSSKDLEERFLGEHQVSLYIGEKNVIVNITVTDCKVTEEGKTSMLAFYNSDDSILQHFNETYNLQYTTKDFSDALSLHADVGDGTTEFVFTEGYNPVPNSSSGKRIGVGHATNDAIELYKEEMQGTIGDINRQEFMKTLLSKGEKGKTAKEMMFRATRGQAINIINEIEEAFSRNTSSNADYFFVHGGGSIIFKTQMYDDLIAFTEKVLGKVVWIPEEHATKMNSRGTFWLAQALYGDK
jgi:plasmid segregation protein ParM